MKQVTSVDHYQSEFFNNLSLRTDRVAFYFDLIGDITYAYRQIRMYLSALHLVSSVRSVGKCEASTHDLIFLFSLRVAYNSADTVHCFC